MCSSVCTVLFVSRPSLPFFTYSCVLTADFGLSLALNSSHAQASSVVGTFDYMACCSHSSPRLIRVALCLQAPEVREGKKYGCNVDVYSLGLTFLCLTVRNFNTVFLLGRCRRSTHWSQFHWAQALAVKEGVAASLRVRMREHYSEELIGVLISCVERDPVKRPSIRPILDSPPVAQRVRISPHAFSSFCSMNDACGAGSKACWWRTVVCHVQELERSARSFVFFFL